MMLIIGFHRKWKAEWMRCIHSAFLALFIRRMLLDFERGDGDEAGAVATGNHRVAAGREVIGEELSADCAVRVGDDEAAAVILGVRRGSVDQQLALDLKLDCFAS